jgi:hypothetical protein
MLEVEQMSTKDRLQRKKYMGGVVVGVNACSRDDGQVPKHGNQVREWNSTKSRGCNSGSSERLRRMNSETAVWFSTAMCMMYLLRKDLKKQHSMNTHLSP